jgi:hypothetical protein
MRSPLHESYLNPYMFAANNLLNRLPQQQLPAQPVVPPMQYNGTPGVSAPITMNMNPGNGVAMPAPVAQPGVSPPQTMLAQPAQPVPNGILARTGPVMPGAGQSYQAPPPGQPMPQPLPPQNQNAILARLGGRPPGPGYPYSL